MSDGALTRAYVEAWRRSYSLENRREIFSRTHPERYWDVFFNLFWYKNSVMNEGAHLNADRLGPFEGAREPAGVSRQGHLAPLRRRSPEIHKLCEARFVVLEIRLAPAGAANRGSLDRELAGMRADVGRGISDLQTVYIRAQARMPSIGVPSRLGLLRERTSLWRVSGPSADAARLGQVLD